MLHPLIPIVTPIHPFSHHDPVIIHPHISVHWSFSLPLSIHHPYADTGWLDSWTNYRIDHWQNCHYVDRRWDGCLTGLVTRWMVEGFTEYMQRLDQSLDEWTTHPTTTTHPPIQQAIHLSCVPCSFPHAASICLFNYSLLIQPTNHPVSILITHPTT